MRSPVSTLDKTLLTAVAFVALFGCKLFNGLRSRRSLRLAVTSSHRRSGRDCHSADRLTTLGRRERGDHEPARIGATTAAPGGG